MRYQLADGNVIVATQDFIDEYYPDAVLLPEPETQEPGPAPVLRHITVGAFFDRFGSFKWAILADTNPQVQAVVKDASVRTYIDLDSPDLPAGLALLQSAGHEIDAETVINDPVLEKELP